MGSGRYIEMGKQIYHMTWDFQDGKWQVLDGKNLPHDMGLPRWEVAANEIGRRIYHMTWDFQHAVPSFERDDKQRDDKFRKTERYGVNHGGDDSRDSRRGKRHRRIRNGWGESKAEKCLVCALCVCTGSSCNSIYAV